MDSAVAIPLPRCEQRQRLYRAVGLLFSVVAGGTAGFSLIEGWDLWRSLFFTLITITTVGYGDEGISEAGKKFASLLLIGGIGVASYAFAQIVQSAVSSQFTWRNQLQKRINQISGHTIVCGFGRMGRAVCSELYGAGRPFVVIERDPASFLQACDAGYLALEGNASEDETLRRAGIERAQHVVSVVSCRAENIFTTLSVRQLRPDVQIVARGEGEEENRKLLLAGATRVVSPFRSGGKEISDVIIRPGVADFLAGSSTGEDGVVLAEMTIAEGSELMGVSLAEYGRSQGTKISFVSVRRDGEEPMLPPPGGVRLQVHDHLIVAGDPKQVAEMSARATCGTVAA